MITFSQFASAVAAAALASSAAAMPPNEIYAKVSPSVFRVQTYDTDGLPLGFGTGVVIAPDTLVTNCHVLGKSKRVAVKREKLSIDAKLEQWDPERDVCQIRTVSPLNAPAVALGDVERLQIGQNVYAIGNPKGLDLTMSAGLLSSIRRNDKGQVFLLQTSAPLSPGSSGGGMFDDNGVLIGLTTSGLVGSDVQNLNFAVPIDWVKELPRRHAKLVAAKAAAAASGTAVPNVTTSVAAAPTPAPSTAVTQVCLNAGKQALEPPGAGTPLADAVSKLPYASDKMRDGYRTFLTCPLPRAFAISEGGKWWYSWSNKPRDTTQPVDPGERALRQCEKTNSGRCFLYAVDQRVVYGEGQ
jgi:serine protease Do